MNPLELPKAFAWRLTPRTSNEYGHLYYLDQEIAVIRQVGQVWIAAINERFASPEFRTCTVPEPVNGQMWLATWARTKCGSIKSVYLGETCAEPQQAWLSQGLTPFA